MIVVTTACILACVSKLKFPKSVDAMLKGADHLLVVAPKKSSSARTLGRVLPEGLAKLGGALAQEVAIGLQGGVATSRVAAAAAGGKKAGASDPPTRLTSGVLPDEVSRYNSAARAEAVRTVVAAAGLQRSAKVAILLVLDREDHQLAAANAVVRALPVYTRKSSASALSQVSILTCTKAGEVLSTPARVRQTLESARDAARRVDIPPTELDPAALAKEARASLRGTGVRFEEIAGPKLLENGLNGIHAVGRCAKSAPRLLVVRYKPGRPRGPHVALVGKGITYDTGGLHIKGRGGMEGMKADMGGAAAVLGAFEVLVREKYPAPLSLLLCLAENAIGPAAYKPDDVIEMHSGKTVEVNNTDAEGRIVLGDGVSWAARKLRADVILDAATLTGAQMVSTGLLHSCCFSNDEALERALVVAGQASGDLTHAMPFAPEFYKSEFASPIADMRNSVRNRANAQVSCAAQFIYWHIEDTDARWGHVDLAGPATRGDRGTGYGVALLAETARRLLPTKG